MKQIGDSFPLISKQIVIILLLLDRQTNRHRQTDRHTDRQKIWADPV